MSRALAALTLALLAALAPALSAPEGVGSSASVTSAESFSSGYSIEYMFPNESLLRVYVNVSSLTGFLNYMETFLMDIRRAAYESALVFSYGGEGISYRREYTDSALHAAAGMRGEQTHALVSEHVSMDLNASHPILTYSVSAGLSGPFHRTGAVWYSKNGYFHFVEDVNGTAAYHRMIVVSGAPYVAPSHPAPP